MEKFKNNKGMTLIEIVVSIAIFGILAVGFLNVFLESLIITTNSGVRTDSVAYVSGEIEKKIADPTGYVNDTNIPSTKVDLVIKYNNGAQTDTMRGDLIEGIEVNEKGQTIEITSFIPE